MFACGALSVCGQRQAVKSGRRAEKKATREIPGIYCDSRPIREMNADSTPLTGASPGGETEALCARVTRDSTAVDSRQIDSRVEWDATRQALQGRRRTAGPTQQVEVGRPLRTRALLRRATKRECMQSRYSVTIFMCTTEPFAK